MGGSISGTDRTVLCVCFAMSFMVMCVVGAVSYTAFTRRCGALEGFLSNQGTWPSPEDLLNRRGEAFAMAGLAQIYTATYRPDHSMFLYPSRQDIARALEEGGGAAAAGATPGTVARPSSSETDTVRGCACEDTVIPSACPSVGAVSTKVLGKAGSKSCALRIFDAGYLINKVCLRLLVMMARGDASTLSLFTHPASPATCLFVLMRPMFVSIPGSNLLRVALLISSGGSNTLQDYDSDRTDIPLVVSLTRVTDPLVSAQIPDTSDTSHSLVTLSEIRPDEKGVTFELVSVRCTGERPPIRDSDPNVGRVLTMYFIMPNTMPRLASELINIRGQRTSLVGRLSTSADGASGVSGAFTLSITGEADVTVAVEPASLVVVTLSDNTLVVSMMSPARVALRCAVMNMRFVADDYGGPDTLRSALQAAGAGVPTGLTPYSTTSIPDLADIAMRYRMLPARTFHPL
ncbi:MAG: hypothetical protein WDW38_006586 [Sanguina aurantia]